MNPAFGRQVVLNFNTFTVIVLIPGTVCMTCTGTCCCPVISGYFQGFFKSIILEHSKDIFFVSSVHSKTVNQSEYCKCRCKFS